MSHQTTLFPQTFCSLKCVLLAPFFFPPCPTDKLLLILQGPAQTTILLWGILVLSPQAKLIAPSSVFPVSDINFLNPSDL